MIAADLTVIVAIENSNENLDAILEALDPTGHPKVCFIFGSAGTDVRLPETVRELANVKTIVVSANRRIPYIWAEGIRQAETAYVGLLTGHFVPKPDWVACASNLSWKERSVGYGGTILNDPNARSMDWAVYLIRYGRYAPPMTAGIVDDIAADNAVYRRDLIMAEKSLLADGFWEPAFHAIFHQRHFELALAPGLVAEHHNRYGARQFASQRFEHATEFGTERAQSKTTLWVVMMIVLAPLLPAVFLLKILAVASSKKYSRRHILLSMGWVICFLSCWGAGEVRGYIRSFRHRITG